MTGGRGTSFLLDSSGSMHPRTDDVIGSFAAFVDAQDPDTLLSLWTFSDTVKCVFRDLPKKDVPKLDFRPSGGTALYDAIGTVLETGPKKLVILTDGEENSSSKFTKAHIKDLIRLSGVDVIYAGVDLEDAKDLGISKRIHYDGVDTPSTMSQLATLASQGP